MDCNCDNGQAYTHHVWCDTYRPQGMTDGEWEESLQRHPLLQARKLSPAEVEEWRRTCPYPEALG